MTEMKINPESSGSLAELLTAVPVKNQSVEIATESENGVTLYVPLRKRWYMSPPFSWVLPIHDRRGVALDGLGRDVWQLCDGENTTEMIVESFAKEHRLSFHEARICVLEFLKMLTRRGVVVIIGSPKQESLA